VVKEAGGDPVQHELPSFTLDQRRKEGPQQGWRSVVARMGMNIDKSQAEKEYDHDIDLINKQLRYARVVGVAGFKGGTGKTAATVCLGSTIGEHRSTGEVVGIDADENGTLARRMKGTQPSNVKAFAADDRLLTTNDVRAHLMVNDHRFSVLGSSTSPTAYPLIPEEYEVAVDRLKDDYSIVMVDMDTSAASPAYETIMDSLHALVLIIAPTLESVSLGQNMVAWLRERDLGDVLSRTLVLINHQSPAKSHVNLEQVVAHFRDREHLKVLEIPWDEHLAEAGEVNLDLLNKPTRRQFVRAAATIIDSLPSS
jgi:MinD-like ATPase involved in chromosome partitioning or flagellar assembly